MRIFIIALILTLLSSPAYSTNWGPLLQGFGKGLEDVAERRRQQEQLDQQYEYERKLQEQQYELKRQRQEAFRQAKERADAAVEEADRKRAEEEKRNSISTGTGFFVDQDGHLITNAHVVEDKSHVAIRDIKGKFYRAKVVAQNRKRDLALLEVDGNFPSLRIVHSDNVEKGQRVIALGYPQISIQGNESKVTDGIVSSFSGIEGDRDWFQISVPIQGGNSGGPLVTENGDVVGVVVATLNVKKFYSITGSMPQNVNYAIKSEGLLSFLSDQKIRNSHQQKAKTSISSVDRATVLVIAKNSPLDVAYEEPPFDLKLEESKLTSLHPDWRTIIKSKSFKAWLGDNPSVAEAFNSQHAKDRAKVMQTYKDETAEQGAMKADVVNQPSSKKSENKLLSYFTDPITGMEFVLVKGGCYMMGSDDGESDEKPMHEVCVDDFYIGKYEVTIRQFQAFVKGSQYRTDAEKKGSSYIWDGYKWVNIIGEDWHIDTSSGLPVSVDHPVVHISWRDADACGYWLSQQVGKSYRLPTEAEWEYAARSGGKEEKWAGTSSDSSLGEYAWLNPTRSNGSESHPVGQKKPNGLGLYDMTGNVWEWCSDWYEEKYYSASSLKNPKGPFDGVYRVYRGGGWNYSPSGSRTMRRLMLKPDFSYNVVGFRLAFSAH